MLVCQLICTVYVHSKGKTHIQARTVTYTLLFLQPNSACFLQRSRADFRFRAFGTLPHNIDFGEFYDMLQWNPGSSC